MGRLIERMGIAADVKAKFRSVPSGGTIGTIVASGDCEIGFQQVSELVHIPGFDYIGPLPAEVQCVTVFSMRPANRSAAIRPRPRRWWRS